MYKLLFRSFYVEMEDFHFYMNQEKMKVGACSVNHRIYMNT